MLTPPLPLLAFSRKRSRPPAPAGFSFVEVLISVFILSIGLMAAIGLVTSSIRQMYGSRDTIIASGLAQEGVELARNIRDNNFAAIAGGSTTTAAFQGWPSGTSTNCRIDKNSTSLSCTGASYNLCISGGFYTHTCGTATKFKRRLFLNRQTGSDGEVSYDVASIAYWGNFPSGLDQFNELQSLCTLRNKCVYSRLTISDWYEYVP